MNNFGKELFKNKEENIFSTGFVEIDEYIKGIEKGSIITIGGRPAMGKTSFAISVLIHLLEKQKKILFFSPVLTNNLLKKRMLMIKTGFNFKI